MITKHNKFTKIFSIIIIAVFSLTANAQTQIEKPVNDAISKGDAKELSKYFNSTIELVLPTDEGNYSQKQAAILLTKFFKENPPKKFTVKHKGVASDNSLYYICEYETQKANFRTYYLCNSQNGKIKLFQLKFDKK